MYEQVSAANHLCLCRNGCDPRLLLCARLSAFGRSLRRAPSWSRLRIRPRYPAIRATSARAAIRFTSRRVSPWGISHAPIRPTSSGPIWCTSRRVLIAPKHLSCRTALGRSSPRSVDSELRIYGGGGRDVRPDFRSAASDAPGPDRCRPMSAFGGKADIAGSPRNTTSKLSSASRTMNACVFHRH